MTRRFTGAFVVAAAMVATGAAQASDDDDLDRIPAAAATPSAASGNANDIVYLQNDAVTTARRNALVVSYPPPAIAQWEERLFGDARLQWALSDDVDVLYSGRLNVRVEDGLGFPNHENIRHDFREGYVAWKIDTSTFLDVGRINLKSGVALGFNPTDFFKTRAVVEPLSADPSVLREDRLGTLMAYGQHLWEDGALAIAFAPKLTRPSALYSNTDLPSFDPVFDRTNSANRLLIKGNIDLLEDFNPELLAYSQDGRWSFGANLTHGFGQKIVAYLEWAGGDRAGLAYNAVQYGETTGSLPAGTPLLLPGDSAHPFQNDAALGLSYTTESKITFNAEYHFHQAGFSAADWHSWFGLGALHNTEIDSALWYIRGYAADQQEAVARQEAFLRADWVDAFVPDLELTAFANIDLRDRSSFSQATADYYLSREWTIGALASATFGSSRSEYGSLPNGSTLMLRVSRYL
jgi:hypothetical protein